MIIALQNILYNATTQMFNRICITEIRTEGLIEVNMTLKTQCNLFNRPPLQ
jgi:hypothetical protein